jgi:hypothetical protein
MKCGTRATIRYGFDLLDCEYEARNKRQRIIPWRFVFTFHSAIVAVTPLSG